MHTAGMAWALRQCPDTLANGASAGNNVVNDFPAVIRRDIRQGDFNAPVTRTVVPITGWLLACAIRYHCSLPRPDLPAQTVLPP